MDKIAFRRKCDELVNTKTPFIMCAYERNGFFMMRTEMKAYNGSEYTRRVTKTDVTKARKLMDKLVMSGNADYMVEFDGEKITRDYGGVYE